MFKNIKWSTLEFSILYDYFFYISNSIKKLARIKDIKKDLVELEICAQIDFPSKHTRYVAFQNLVTNSII